MTWLATCGGRTRKVQVEEPLPGIFRVVLEDREYRVDFLEPRRDLLSLLIDGRSFEVDVDAVPGFEDVTRVEIRGDRYDVEVVEARRRKLAMKRAKGASGRQDIRSPMAGNVRRVLAAPGDRVEPGQVLLILEAMKMQNQITSPVAGHLASMSAREGVPVALGAPLCVVEPLPDNPERP